jgi:TRAP-type C4-dicarboxylate transport system permease small subunit
MIGPFILTIIQGEMTMKKFNEYLYSFERNVSKVLLLSMVVLVFISAIARFAGHPMNWAVDLSTFMFAWACFLAVDIAWKEDKMMSVDVLIRKLPEKWQKFFKLINYFIISAFLVYLVIWGFYLYYTTRFRTFVGIPNFSYSWVTLSIAVGAVLMLRTTIIKIKKELTKPDKLKLKEDK